MTINAYAIPGIKECDRSELVSLDGKINRTLEKVCKHYSVNEYNMKSKSRKRNIVTARQMCMYFLRTNLSLTLNEIGRITGGRDHTTVIHSINLIKSQLSIPVENAVKSDYEKLIQII